ncbi:hypothetical protein C8R44DRAFT_798474 [Mycena epipterygia]|nr:hypothetical protein C8R44DRAFT_798474 [Mycena epipterygia]
MFTKICFALALAVSSASSLSVNAPTSPTSGGTTTITWSSTSSDPVFSIELIHPSFNSAFGIANNVNPANNNITLTIPPVPAESGYTLEFVNVTDINQVFATSSSFSIGAAVSASASPTSSGTAAGGSASAPAGSAGTSGSGSASGAKPSSTSPSASGSSSGSSSAPSSSGTNTPSGAIRAVPATAGLVIALAAAVLVL